ncbi:MAG: prepilin-type N-terminal cleavage/methylation domain-containing protein [Gammaproteobacteria bacterium]|nr:MAG: prepilin-type N-terminal cleavage/methylation domain-containing protein [Gammaproteobacteria bacterium]
MSARMRSCSARERGLSLIELMVAITISLVILAALVAMFVNTSRSNREFARANSMIENGRLAVQVLESDVVHAGFWGTHVPEFDDQTAAAAPADAPTAVPDPCLVYDPGNWTAAYLRNLIGIPVQAYDDATVCAGILADRLAGTDVLIVRHAEPCVPGGPSPNCEADAAGRLYFQSSLCLTDPADYVFDTVGFTLLRRDCATLAEKRRFMSSIYYVRDHAVTAGDGIPTLMRAQFDLTPLAAVLEHQPAVPLIEGIQGFRVELGVDDQSETGAAVDYTTAVQWADPDTRTTPTNRGDGVPDDDFLRCTTADPCTVAELANVTAVRLYILARSREPSQGHTDGKAYVLGSAGAVGPFGDAFQRHLFVTTIRLPNISGRRITP